MKFYIHIILLFVFLLTNKTSLLGQADQLKFNADNYSLEVDNPINNECNKFYERSKGEADTLTKIKFLRKSAQCYLLNNDLKNVETLLNQAKILSVQLNNLTQQIKIDIELSNLLVSVLGLKPCTLSAVL